MSSNSTIRQYKAILFTCFNNLRWGEKNPRKSWFQHTMKHVHLLKIIMIKMKQNLNFKFKISILLSSHNHLIVKVYQNLFSRMLNTTLFLSEMVLSLGIISSFISTLLLFFPLIFTWTSKPDKNSSYSVRLTSFRRLFSPSSLSVPFAPQIPPGHQRPVLPPSTSQSAPPVSLPEYTSAGRTSSNNSDQQATAW